MTALGHLAGQTAVLHLDVWKAAPSYVVVPPAIEFSKQARNTLERSIATVTLDRYQTKDGWMSQLEVDRIKDMISEPEGLYQAHARAGTKMRHAS